VGVAELEVLPGIILVAVCTTVLSAYTVITIPIPTKPYDKAFVTFIMAERWSVIWLQKLQVSAYPKPNIYSNAKHSISAGTP
jgi:hypothetical protein